MLSIFLKEQVVGEIEEKTFKGTIGRITQDALQYIKNRYLQEKIVKVPIRLNQFAFELPVSCPRRSIGQCGLSSFV